jgi:hypothetical protein
MRDKWTPETVMTLKGHRPVQTVTAYPPDGHPAGCCIRPDLTVVALQTDCGTRFYGVKSARIDSYLRMRVSGFDPRFEEMNAWPDAKPE